MNLYLISQSVHKYDAYNAIVVAAQDEQEARNTPPYIYYDWKDSSWANRPEQVKVELIGVAKSGTLAGVILAYYNAG